MNDHVALKNTTFVNRIIGKMYEHFLKDCSKNNWQDACTCGFKKTRFVHRIFGKMHEHVGLKKPRFIYRIIDKMQEHVALNKKDSFIE